MEATAEIEDSLCDYHIRIETGNRRGSGTNANVSITLTGTGGDTKTYKLDKWFLNDFEARSKDEYTVKGKDVGDLLFVRLTNDNTGLFSDWFVHRVVVRKARRTRHEEVYHFPFHRWVVSEAVLFEGKALLSKSIKHQTVKEQRTLELQHRQKQFQWGDDPVFSVDLPGAIKATDPKALPKDVQFTEEATKNLKDAKRQALVNLGLGKFFSLFESWDDFEDYRSCFTVYVGDVPSVANSWKDDAVFGAQFLNGCNPNTIKRCKTLPPNFPVTEETVANVLDDGMTLKRALESGRIYTVDHKILEGIPHYGENDPDLDRRYTSASMGLFYVRNSGDMVPIAIQMHQEPSNRNPIWTPNDSEHDWLYAKMWLRNADAQYHQMVTHLLQCHLMMEPIAVATWRNLPSSHPLWKLLFPHIKGVMSINTLGRQKLISKGGVSDKTLSIGGGGHVQLMQKAYRTITWDQFNIPKVFKDRGIDDPEKLPKFYYRDDALVLWNAISEFVKEILAVYYSSDKDVREDPELKSWALDLNTNGYPSKNGAVEKGFPSSFSTLEQLNRFLTMAIFTCSCQHAAVNFSQMDTYGYVPNSPALMHKPPPIEKGKVDLKFILEALPNKQESCVYIAILHDLSQVYPTEKFLGDSSDSLFTDKEALAAITNFQRNLQKISAAIKKRNEGLAVPYMYLLPERIPTSIAI